MVAAASAAVAAAVVKAILVPILSDGAGAATQTFDLHAAVTGVLYQQFVPIDFATFSFRASNGLSITAW